MVASTFCSLVTGRDIACREATLARFSLGYFFSTALFALVSVSTSNVECPSVVTSALPERFVVGRSLIAHSRLPRQPAKCFCLIINADVCESYRRSDVTVARQLPDLCQRRSTMHQFGDVSVSLCSVKVSNSMLISYSILMVAS